MKNLIFIALFILQCLSVYVLHRNYVSYQEQIKIYPAINGGSFIEENEFFANMETTLPNLSTSSIPLKAIKGYYYLANYGNDSLDLALKLLHQGIKDNPYLMYSEGTIASIYHETILKDSAEIYSRKAFKGIPKNAIHFAMIAKMYANQGKYDSIISSFEKVKSPPQLKIYTIFLASMMNFIDKVDTTVVKKHARFAKFWWPYQDENLVLLADYHIYGKEQVTKSIELENKAELLLKKKKYNEGLEVLKKSLSLRKNNLGLYQSIGLVYFNLGDHKKVIEVLEDVREKALNIQNIDIDPMSVYALGLSYRKNKQYAKACEMFSIGVDQKFDLAKESYLKYCAGN